jgi:hypothetical protein
MTDVVRADPPRGSLAAIFSLLGLTFALGLFVFLSIIGFLQLHPQVVTSLWMGMVFLVLAALIDIYRREFLPDEMIHKKRRPKVVYRRAIR